jgi:hypothetical protein
LAYLLQKIFKSLTSQSVEFELHNEGYSRNLSYTLN